MLYAPILESNIPAFTRELIKIPFSMNPAVSINEFQYFAFQIKTMTGAVVLRNIADNILTNSAALAVTIDLASNFPLDNSIGVHTDLKEGQYYKVQLGFVADSDITYNPSAYVNFDNIKFSDVAIGRCIVAPEIKINDWDHKTSHYDTMIYKGQTLQQTPSETVSQYRFTVVEASTNQILQDSGWLAHNSSTDEFDNNNYRITTDEFELLYELGDVFYKINYSIKTNNGYETQVEYYITGNSSAGTLTDVVLNVAHSEMKRGLGKENGFVILSIKGAEIPQDTIAGNYKIRRFSNSKNMWENIFNFSLGEAIDDKTQDTWLDLAIEQGETYEYKLVKYFKGATENDVNYLYGEPISILVDYEDVFLSDGERQLCMKYNPKISSLKETIQEAKQDTLGGKYPFFFRNGNLGYKEIPLNGLISFNLDEAQMFMSRKELGITELPNINLDGKNFTAERKFKLEVLNWLNNGKPKLFRSPAEGVYVVRLMNVSLSPEEKLGRMLHSFSATGYEVAPTDYASLMKYNLVFNNKEVIENVKLLATD